MSLAFHILAHKNPAQVAHLVQALGLLADDVCIVHYDKARPAFEVRELHGRLDGRPGVVFQQRQHIAWGGWSLIQAQLDGLALASKRSPNWSHWINLSGQDLPLVSPSELRARLARAENTSFMSWFDPEGVWTDWIQRAECFHPNSYWLERLLRVPGLGRRLRSFLAAPNAPARLESFRRSARWFRYLGSSNWVILSRDSARRLLFEPEAIRIRRWLRWSGIPDESLFPSVLLNLTPLPTIQQGENRFMEFVRGSSSPRVLGLADLPAIEAARRRGALFARKFDGTIDPEIISAIERWHHSPPEQGDAGDRNRAFDTVAGPLRSASSPPPNAPDHPARHPDL